MPFGCLALIFFAGILFVPLFFANAILTALNKLGLSPALALLSAVGIFMGSMINVPVHSMEREDQVEVISPSMYGLTRIRTPWVQNQYITVALNLGGAIIPLILVVHELVRVIARGNQTLMVTVIAVGINVIVCYVLARPVQGVGIALSPFIPAVLAALSAWILVPDYAPPIAFIAGVLGPVIGADLLHLEEVKGTHVNVVSIGGAGTFDGIVLSGLVATLLA
jgi:uncharacterized membrane protein